MPNTKQCVLILHNPKSGSHHALDVIRALSSRLTESGYCVEDYDSLDVFHARSKELIDRGELRAVIAGGGDGTAAAVAARISSDVPLWLCPLGTENLLARYLGMTSDPDQAVASISRLRTKAIDAGLANGRLFLVMVGVGFDAEVVHQVHSQRTGHIRKYHYWLPILRTAMSYRFPSIKLVADSPIINVKKPVPIDDVQVTETSTSSRESHEATWYFLLNLPRYASGLNIAPNAQGDDGLIDICAFKRGGLFSGLYYFARLRLGIHAAHSDFSQLRAAKFRIEPASPEARNISYQLDGDWGGYLPLEVECLPGRLRVIEPI